MNSSRFQLVFLNVLIVHSVRIVHISYLVTGFQQGRNMWSIGKKRSIFQKFAEAKESFLFCGLAEKVFQISLDNLIFFCSCVRFVDLCFCSLVYSLHCLCQLQFLFYLTCVVLKLEYPYRDFSEKKLTINSPRLPQIFKR